MQVPSLEAFASLIAKFPSKTTPCLPFALRFLDCFVSQIFQKIWTDTSPRRHEKFLGIWHTDDKARPSDNDPQKLSTPKIAQKHGMKTAYWLAKTMAEQFLTAEGDRHHLTHAAT